MPELPRTGDLEDVRLALATAAPLDLPPDYLVLNQELPRWRQLLSDIRTQRSGMGTVPRGWPRPFTLASCRPAGCSTLSTFSASQ